MASYSLTMQEVMSWEGNMDMIASGCTMPKDIYACLRDMSVKRTAIIFPPEEKECWDCPYCGALNYTKVGHCHHCASPRRY